MNTNGATTASSGTHATADTNDATDAVAAANAAAASTLVPRHVHFLDGAARGARPAPQSLGGGAAGVALLHAYRARIGRGDPAVTRRWLQVATSDPITAGPDANLYYGAPALAFVTHIAATTDPTLRRAHDQLHEATIQLTRRRLDAAHLRIDRGAPARLAEFDLIRGLAGLGAYHLQAEPAGACLRDILAYLVRLTEPLPGRDHVPGWWTEDAPNGSPSPEFPGGHGNLGMSHGISAPLALLAHSTVQGTIVPGQPAAIRRICAWRDTWRQWDTGSAWWPGYVTRDQAHTGVVPAHSRQRPSWCYGTPGLARAEQLAALATGDTERQRTAEAAMLACLQDIAQLDRITDAGLCHGMAGVLHTAWRMSGDATTFDLTRALPTLTARLVERMSRPCADPELLDGHTGAALTLHTIATSAAIGSPAVPALWDACLMLT